MTKVEEKLRTMLESGELDTAYITKTAAKYGVKICQSGCRDRYKDAAILILVAIKEKENLKSERKYLLRAGKDVIWRGIRINSLTSDEELAKYIADGFPQQLMARIDGVDL